MKLDLFILSICFFAYAKIANSLECYVCKNQEDNSEKCVKTLKTCEHYEDMCLTEISWGTTPYWQAGALKQYYISKSCSTSHHCNRTISKLASSCTHIWYEDWKCADCCQGDRCNYYIISGSNSIRGCYSFFLGLTTVLFHKLWFC